MGVNRSYVSDAKRIKTTAPDLFDQIKTGRLSIREANRVVGRRIAESRPVPKAVYAEDAIQVHHCDFRDLEISADSVRLIFTDPPYGLDFLPLWGELGKFAKKVLVSEGTCASYSGIAYLPNALQALAASLEYRWMCSIVHGGGGRPLFRERAAIQGWKPVLLFSKGKHRVCNAIEDTILGSGREKSHHPWQQRVDEAEKFISKLSDPGDVVCDPFLGSGTTALACKRLGRRFIGCDVDPDAVEKAKSRLKEMVCLR